MDDAERRRLVFTNLLNGLSIAQVMEGFHLSEAEVWKDYDFCIAKIRAYRFQRLMPIIPLQTLEFARAHRLDALYTLSRINLAKDPEVKVAVVPYDPTGGTSEAERIMMEMAARAADRRAQ